VYPGPRMIARRADQPTPFRRARRGIDDSYTLGLLGWNRSGMHTKDVTRKNYKAVCADPGFEGSHPERQILFTIKTIIRDDGPFTRDLGLPDDGEVDS